MPSPTWRPPTSSEPPRVQTIRLLALALPLPLVLALGACGRPDSDDARPSSRGESEAPQGYAEALAALDQNITQARLLAQGPADSGRDPSWSDHELVAGLCVRRARLSGAFEDWLAAQEALDAAFALAPAGGGPLLSKAELELSLHRPEQAARWLERAAKAPVTTPAEARRARAIRGDLARARGDLDQAARLYRQTQGEGRGAAPQSALAAARLALVARDAGEFEDARAAFDRALAQTLARGETGHPVAWLYLQRGLVEWEADAPAQALEFYAAAEAAFPGWWRVTEHRAEALAALGDRQGAVALYGEVVQATDDPTFMVALAALLDDEDPAAAQRLRERAARARARRAALLPGVSSDHDH